MSERPVIRVHTINDWVSLPDDVKAFILTNLKVKERLQTFLFSLNTRQEEQITEPVWTRCPKCVDSLHPGYLLKEPRYAGLHPSSAHHSCLLRIFHDMVGTPKQERVEARLRLTFDLGHAAHHMFQTYGRRGAWGPRYESEVEVSHQPLAEQLLLEGHADAENIIVIDVGDGPIFEIGVVHEYKTINHEGFLELKRPKPDHKQQAMFYAAALDRPIMVFLYIDKNDSNLSDFPVPFDFTLWNMLHNKALALRRFYETNTPPPGETGFYCRDCPYNYMCPHYQARR
jgi:CRISPR/Cas system-associated exonuclease Cas4 (RecB family)